MVTGKIMSFKFLLVGMGQSMRILCFNSLAPGKVFPLFCCLLIFFKITFFEKFFHVYHHSVKQFGSRSGPKLFAKVISRRLVDNELTHIIMH